MTIVPYLAEERGTTATAAVASLTGEISVICQHYSVWGGSEALVRRLRRFTGYRGKFTVPCGEPMERIFLDKIPSCVKNVPIQAQFNTLENDNTKPLARMGRKAYRVSPRQPGRRNIQKIFGPGYFYVITCVARAMMMPPHPGCPGADALP